MALKINYFMPKSGISLSLSLSDYRIFRCYRMKPLRDHWSKDEATILGSNASQSSLIQRISFAYTVLKFVKNPMGQIS